MTTTPPGDDPGSDEATAPGTGAGPGTQQDPRASSGDTGPRVAAADVRDLGRLRRTVGPDRYVAGVGGGIARHLDIDPVVVRVALVVLAFFGGAGLLLYGVAWLVVPEDGTDRGRLAMDPRSRTVALVATGVLAALALLGDTLGGNWFPWPLALVALLVFLVLTRRDRRGPASPATTAGPAGGAPPPYAGGTPAYAGGAAPPPGDTVASGAGWAPPPPPTPPNPRRRGPRLFPVTLALAALAIGVLVTVDVAGVAVAPPVYPAAVLGVVTAMLLLASVWGRGGGLVALGLLAAVVLGVTSGADRFDDGDRSVHRPTSAADVRASYDIGMGELVVDLTRVRDLEELDGRTIDVSAQFGAVEVLVPEDLDVAASARTSGPGGLTVFGRDAGGVDVTTTGEHDGGVDAPRLDIDAEVGVGEIVMRTR